MNSNRKLVSRNANSQDEQLLDLKKVALRHKALIALGIAIGLVIGALYYAQSTPVFRSSAQVLIVRKTPNTEIKGQNAFYNDYMSTHQALIKSSVIISRASQLPEISALKTKTKELHEGLNVELDENADNILHVSFEGEVPEECPVIIRGILNTYQDYLEETYDTMSTDTVQLISEARDLLLRDIRKQEFEYREFRRESPLLTTDEGGSNPVYSRIAAIQRQQSELLLRRTELESLIQSLENAIESGLEPKHLAMLISNAGVQLAAMDDDAEPMGLDRLRMDQKFHSLELEDERDLAEGLEAMLLPLKQQEQELLTLFGPGHPTLASVRLRIEEAKNFYKTLEKEYEEHHVAIREYADEAVDVGGYRKWKDASGTMEVSARLISEEENKVTLERENNGKRVTLATASLSSDDQRLLAKIRADRIRKHEELSEMVEMGLTQLRQELDRTVRTQELLRGIYDTEYVSAKELTDFEIAEEEFQSNMEHTRQLYDGVVAQLQAASLSRDYGGFKANVISPPGFAWKVKPEALIVFPMAIFVGTFFGFGLACLAELANRTFRTSDEISKHLMLPVIGRIALARLSAKPQLDPEEMDDSLDRSLCTYFRPISVESESYRALRTTLFFHNRSREQSVIQVTSACPGDGKSTVAGNLGVSIAQSGKRVLLIDADLRKPRQHLFFGSEIGIGLSNMIVDGAEPTDAIRATPVHNLWLLSAGQKTPDPAELLTSTRFAELMAQFREDYDYVIVDSGPLLAVSDPRIVMAHTDGLLLSVRLDKTTRKQAETAREILLSLDAPIIGIVANCVRTSELDALGRARYGYGAYEGYHQSRNGTTSKSPSRLTSNNGHANGALVTSTGDVEVNGHGDTHSSNPLEERGNPNS
ncbi:polysaccharide biosynthesis tyrosine autokinase [Rhodopirellula sallentina]|uniref:non-specific protein-tyrosine kinase n=1 Tax=Rhodopirellula sallentina SM41 TaxID=1263870 RepID=M5TW92_9BACT|nr:polysaccharide biosynthesis tyrosine autokinase [Rhodopirellula sallentina]EMI53445.1 Exopolysaccharide synthesis protein [Rhodopirellula sallentina SM41]